MFSCLLQQSSAIELKQPLSRLEWAYFHCLSLKYPHNDFKLPTKLISFPRTRYLRLSSTPNRLLLPDSSAGSALQALTITISSTPSRRISAAGVVWMLLPAVGCPARACCCRFMAGCLLATGRSKVGHRLFRVSAQPNELPQSLAGRPEIEGKCEIFLISPRSANRRVRRN